MAEIRQNVRVFTVLLKEWRFSALLIRKA